GTGKDAYEPRIVEIPALYISSIWLHGKKGDIFFPFLGAEEGAAVREDPAFITRVVEAARAAHEASLEDAENAEPAEQPQRKMPFVDPPVRSSWPVSVPAYAAAAAPNIIFAGDARERMLLGVDILANAVRVTLGPKGRNVVIERSFGAPRITKDGVTVAK